MLFRSLYESIDACTALDEIDCDAWDEFHIPCQFSIKSRFGAIDFTNRAQCEFIEGTCGNVAPFPSFRHLDCQTEIPQGSWDFYNEYKNGCVNGAAQPVSAPTESPISLQTKPPTPYEPVKPANIKPNREPTTNNYGQPSNQRPSYKSPDEKPRSHWFRNTVFLVMAVVIAYYFYKKQSDGFSFVRYRRMTNFNRNNGVAFGMMDDGDTNLYSGLSLESSSMHFEPPTLPPTPMSMSMSHNNNNGGYGA